jgi:hypothetical protein
MHCFFTKLRGEVPVLYMTPRLTDAHLPIIAECGLQYVKVTKSEVTKSESKPLIPRKGFILTPTDMPPVA